MAVPGSRPRWRRSPLLGPLLQPLPDVVIDFATGRGIPVAQGGAGGRGSELVQITSPQDDGGGARLVRAARYYDPAAHWRPGEPIFVPKVANRLVGWPGPRAGGYWTGPMPSLASTSETVEVYTAVPGGLAVQRVSGGVVGPDAQQCTVAAGRGGGGGWTQQIGVPIKPRDEIEPSPVGTVLIAHIICEVFGDPSIWQPYIALYDYGSSQFRGSTMQKFTDPPGAKSRALYRGVGPHGGSLYEWWAVAQFDSAPTGDVRGSAYLLHAPGNNTDVTLIIHGMQMHFAHWRGWPLNYFPPFFSYARGTPVVWTSEQVSVAHDAEIFSAAMRVDYNGYPETAMYNALISRNGNYAGNAIYQTSNTHLMAKDPGVQVAAGPNVRLVYRTEAGWARAICVDGDVVQHLSPLTPPGGMLTSLVVGKFEGEWATGLFRRTAIWRRALTDAEMRQAWRSL